ncbi:MAG TPA: hypothetical protein VGN69_10590 [Solirubrobacteraceae bacterium]|jgi:hypothetical protein|nr:hypothetical protein [Solirubrobacteraceae bacterium]
MVVSAPAVVVAPVANVYEENADLGTLLTPAQRSELSQNTLSQFPVWGVVVLHIVTLGLFSLIYQGLKFSKLPKAKHDDFGADKAIGFSFIPYFNLYWHFVFWLGLTDRLNFQHRVRGGAPPISRGLVLATVITTLAGAFLIIPLPVAYLILQPMCLAQMQRATNEVAMAPA